MYDAASLKHAFATARTYNTYSQTFVCGILAIGGCHSGRAGGERLAARNQLVEQSERNFR